MNLLADENQHPAVVARLCEAGFSFEFVREMSPGAQDEDILSRPDIGSLILLTFDRDFGDLIFNQGFPAPAAILYMRLSRIDPDVIAERLLALLNAGITLGHITAVTAEGERVKPFPTGATDD